MQDDARGNGKVDRPLILRNFEGASMTWECDICGNLVMPLTLHACRDPIPPPSLSKGMGHNP